MTGKDAYLGTCGVMPVKPYVVGLMAFTGSTAADENGCSQFALHSKWWPKTHGSMLTNIVAGAAAPAPTVLGALIL